MREMKKHTNKPLAISTLIDKYINELSQYYPTIGENEIKSALLNKNGIDSFEPFKNAIQTRLDTNDGNTKAGQVAG